MIHDIMINVGNAQYALSGNPDRNIEKISKQDVNHRPILILNASGGETDVPIVTHNMLLMKMFW